MQSCVICGKSLMQVGAAHYYRNINTVKYPLCVFPKYIISMEISYNSLEPFLLSLYKD